MLGEGGAFLANRNIHFPGLLLTIFELVSILELPTSIVIPRVRSSPVSSSTQAYIKLCLPNFLLSCSCLCITRCDTFPVSYNKWPMSVLLPASTCPMTTICRCFFSLPRSFEYNCCTLRFCWSLVRPVDFVDSSRGEVCSGVFLPETAGDNVFGELISNPFLIDLSGSCAVITVVTARGFVCFGSNILGTIPGGESREF